MQHRAIVRRAYSSLVAKTTRQENSSKSFRVLMDIGPHLCSSVDNHSPIPWPQSDGELSEFRRSLRSVGLRSNRSSNGSTGRTVFGRLRLRCTFVVLARVTI